MSTFREDIEAILSEMEEHIAPNVSWLAVFHAKIQQAIRRDDLRQVRRETQAQAQALRLAGTLNKLQRRPS